MDSILPFIGPLGGPEIIVILMMLIVPATLVLLIVALVSCLSANFKEPINKLIWILVIIFFPLIGSILYFAISGNQRIK